MVTVSICDLDGTIKRHVGQFDNLPNRHQLRAVMPDFDSWFYGEEQADLVAAQSDAAKYRLQSLPPNNAVDPDSEVEGDCLCWEEI
jgi:hypothetical protein